MEKDNLFQCPICQNSEYRIMGKPFIPNEMEKFIRKKYRIVRCNQCRGYSVNPAIDFTKEEWSQIYNISYFSNPSEKFIVQRKKETKEKLNRLAAAVDSKNIRYLDIGCGEGFSLIDAFERSWECFAVDITDHRIENAKNDKINFIKGTLFNANYPSDYFDIVYLDSVLEHVTNPKEYLNEIYRIMKKNGVLYIGVPNEDSFISHFMKLYYLISKRNISEKIKPFANPFHVIGFSDKTLLYIINNKDLEIVEFRNFARKFEFRFFSISDRMFWIRLLISPIELLAFLLRNEYYFDLIIKK